MDEIKFKLIGESPLLMHNNRLANPLDKYSQELSKKSGKRKKTIEDILELARIEWEGGLYLYDGEVKIPARVVNKTFERGATKQACEFSGIVREAFKARGHYHSWSCDYLDTEITGFHFKGDVFSVIDHGWDLMIAFPPCTHLAVSGARWSR